MFTGIITDIGTVIKVAKALNTAGLTVETKYDVSKIAIGASVSCNGCCLTVAKKKKNLLSFDLSPETLEKTNFRKIRENDKVNLERSLKAGDELGGHIVTGHIDTLAEVVSIRKVEGNRQIKFKVPLSYKKYITPKGSVTLNGVSLTVNNVENNVFEVNIVPHTLKKTNLRLLQVGSKVNFETDMIARYLEKLIQK